MLSRITVLGKKLIRYFKDVRSEMRKVLWPGRRQTVVYTGIVMVACVFVASLTWVADSIFGLFLGLLIR